MTLPLLWIGLLVALVLPAADGARLPVDLRSAVIGAIAGYLSLWLVYQLFRLLTGKEGMGYGDFKLLAALGAWLGWQMLLPLVIGAAGVGAVVGIAAIVPGTARQGRAHGLRPLPRGLRLADAVCRAGAGGLLPLAVRPTVKLQAMLRIALTGGIASGKSTVAQLFAGAGRNAHRHRPDRARSGHARIPCPAANRRALRHAACWRRTARWIARAAPARVRRCRRRAPTWKPSCIRPSAHGSRSSARALADPTSSSPCRCWPRPGRSATTIACWWWTANRQLQLRRLMVRDGLAEADARRMIDAQAAREARLAIADDVIRQRRRHHAPGRAGAGAARALSALADCRC